MSTVFNVIPGTSSIPTVGDVLEGTQSLLTTFLAEHGIARHYTVSFTIIDELPYTRNRKSRRTFFNRLLNRPEPLIEVVRRIPDPQELFTWPGDKYGWFFLEGVAGGCDCYVEEPPQPWEESNWCDSLQRQIDRGWPVMPLQEMYAIGREWSFRRSMNEPPIISLTYGLLAAQVAKLTGGVLDTGDCAWQYDFPVYADEFLQFYFRPDNPINSKYNREWAEVCLDSIRLES